MSGFFAAVYGFVALAYGFALVILASRFFHTMAFSLAPQHFQLSVHEIFFVYPTVYRVPARHLQVARCAGNLLRRPGGFELFVFGAQLRGSVIFARDRPERISIWDCGIS